MLGESRLMMDKVDLKQGPAPIRNATLVANGHVVLLTMTTAAARECFQGDVLAELRGLGKARQYMLHAPSPMWPGVEEKVGAWLLHAGAEDKPQVC